MYFLTSLFPFYTAPLCHEQQKSAKHTGIRLMCIVIHHCSADSLPLSVVIILSAPLYTAGASSGQPWPQFCLLPVPEPLHQHEVGLPSTIVGMALLSLSTVRSISQSQKTSAVSLGRLFMLTQFFIFGDSVLTPVSGGALIFHSIMFYYAPARHLIQPAVARSAALHHTYLPS